MPHLLIIGGWYGQQNDFDIEPLNQAGNPVTRPLNPDTMNVASTLGFVIIDKGDGTIFGVGFAQQIAHQHLTCTPGSHHQCTSTLSLPVITIFP